VIRASLIILALAAGCSPTLSAQSMAPPGRAARLDTIDGFWGIKGYRLALSKGVAIAVTCNHGGPCGKLRVTSDDPSIAEVHDASLGVLQPSHGGVYAPDNQATAAAFVVVGKTAGTTKVRVKTNDGGRTIDVTIVPPPELALHAVVAR
jgi:hypothetical protein